MSEQKAITNPFPGLRPFETNEYRLFFGREGQSDALIERLQRARFLAVVGTSGSGKSSLVRAGLLPALRGGMMAGAGAGWRVAVMRPGHDPIGNLARVLSEEGVLAELGAGLSRVEAEAVVEATLRRGSLGLVDAVRQARVGEHEKLLVVVDQFEELFRFRTARMATDTDDDASAFVKLLLETRQPDKPPEERMPIYVVLTMRSDFLGDCAQFQGLPEAINDGQYLIPRMTRDERRFAISGPVRVARGKISEPLVNRLLNDVGDNPDQLPILQHALMRTWDHWHRHRRDGEPIGIDHYTAVGTMSAALSLHADEAWDELPDERSRQIAEVLFKALTERGADNREIRRPTRLREICDIAGASETEVVAVIDVFRREGRSFLMPPAGVPVTSETVVDISHESLIRNWVRLKEWVRDEAEAARIYRRLAEAAMAYRTGEGGLLDEVTLQWVQKWRDKYAPTAAWGVRYHPEFDTAIAYLEESRTARDERISSEREREQRELERARAFAEQQARANHKLRAMMVALAALLLLAMATAVYAYAAKKQAETSERNALNLKDEADKQKAQIASLLESEKAEKDKARAAQITADEQAQIARDQRTEADAARQDAVNALAAAQTAERKATDALNKLNAEVANDHRNRDALASFQRGNLEEAEAKLAALLPVYRNEPQRQAWVYSYLGAARRRLGKLDESIADLKTAQGIQGRQLKGDDAEYLDTITWLGLAHSDKGNYDLAQPLYESALKIRRGGGKHTYVAVSLEHLARNYNNLGQVEEAAKHYEEALNFRRKNPSSPDLIAALKEVAEFHLELGDSEGAIKLYEEALGNQEKYLEPDDPNIADTFAAMAQVYEESPYKGQAKQLNALARGIRALNRYRDDSAEKMNHTAEVAWTYAVIGRFQQAARLRVRAQEVEDRRAGPDSHGAAYDLIRLGDFFRSAAQLAPEADDRKKFYADAASTYQRALDISERKSDGKSKLEALDGLAGLHLDQKNFAEAARFYKIALDIREQTQQASDIRLSVVKDGHKAEMAVSLDGLAQAAAGLGQNAEAEAYFLRTQKVFDDMSDFMLNYVGGVSPTMLFLRHATRARLAEFYRGQGRVKEADEQYRPLARRLKEVRRDYLTHEGIAQSYLDIIEGAGRFYTERGDTAAAESFYRLVWPEGVAPSVSVIPVWPEELYEKTMMAIAPASSIDKMIRILESYAALLEKAGRERDAGLISHGVVRLQWRKLAEGVLPQSAPQSP